MTQKTMLKRLALKDSDFEEIKQAVVEAEKSTSGEIALALTAESSSYAFWELLSSILTSCALFVCIFPLSAQVYSWLDSMLWGMKPSYLTAFYFVVCALLVLVLYCFYNIPAVDRLIIPLGARNSAVSSGAMKYFAESGVYCTKEHSGILIYVSYFEKQVRIIADKGISEKISPDLWKLIADEMTENLAGGNAKEAYLGAIKRCGELLAENFPCGKENPDELNDGLVIVERGKWE